MGKIRRLRMGEDMVVQRNGFARAALAELEENGDAVSVILRLTETIQEQHDAMERMRKRDAEMYAILEKADQKLQELLTQIYAK